MLVYPILLFRMNVSNVPWLQYWKYVQATKRTDRVPSRMMPESFALVVAVVVRRLQRFLLIPPAALLKSFPIPARPLGISRCFPICFFPPLGPKTNYSSLSFSLRRFPTAFSRKKVMTIEKPFSVFHLTEVRLLKMYITRIATFVIRTWIPQRDIQSAKEMEKRWNLGSRPLF